MKRDTAVLIAIQFALLALQAVILAISDPAVLSNNLPLFFFASICIGIVDAIRCLAAEHYEVVDWQVVGMMAAEVATFTIFKGSSLALFFQLPYMSPELRLTFLYFDIAHEVLCYGAALGLMRRLLRYNDEVYLYFLLQLSYFPAAAATLQLGGAAPQDMARLLGATAVALLAHVPWLGVLLAQLVLRRSQLAPLLAP